MTRKFWWGEFSAADFKTIDPHETIAVLPVAAVEQHGPHLPLETDTAIMRGMLAGVFEILPEGLDARFLPVQEIGKSNEHIRFPGTLTVSAATLAQSWCDIGDCVARAGIRKLAIVNSHGGNEEIVGIVAREMRVRHAMLAVKTAWTRFGLPDGLFSEAEQKFGIHGGDVETSLMLHFRPDLVDMAKAKNFASRAADASTTFRHLGAQGPHAFAWLAGDLNPAGAVGEAHLATATKGKAVADHQARGFVELLGDIRKARLEDWLRG